MSSCIRGMGSPLARIIGPSDISDVWGERMQFLFEGRSLELTNPGNHLLLISVNFAPIWVAASFDSCVSVARLEMVLVKAIVASRVLENVSIRSAVVWVSLPSSLMTAL